MKKFIIKKIIENNEAPKIIINLCFFPSLVYILLYELVFINYTSYNKFVYKLGIILISISYSILASSIFYIISQYLPVYLPKHKRKIKILFNIYHKIFSINDMVEDLKNKLEIENEEYKTNKYLHEKLKKINANNSVCGYNNYYEYLSSIKVQLIEIIRSITIYEDYMEDDLFQELIIIEKQLLKPFDFSNVKPDYAVGILHLEIELQEIFIHNEHLKQINSALFGKYEKEFQKDGSDYRTKYYNNVKTKI